MKRVFCLTLLLALGLAACNLPPEALGRTETKGQDAIETVVASTLTAEANPRGAQGEAEAAAASPDANSTSPGSTPEASPTPSPTAVPTLPPPAYQTYSLTPKEEVTALAIDTQALYYVSSQAADRISRISLDGIISDLIVDLEGSGLEIRGPILANGIWLVYKACNSAEGSNAFSLNAVYLETHQDFPLIVGFEGGTSLRESVEYALDGGQLLVTRCEGTAEGPTSCRADIFYLSNGGQMMLQAQEMSSGQRWTAPALTGTKALWLEETTTEEKLSTTPLGIDLFTFETIDLGEGMEPAAWKASSGLLLWNTAGSSEAEPVYKLYDFETEEEINIEWPGKLVSAVTLTAKTAAAAAETEGLVRMYTSLAGAAPQGLIGSEQEGSVVGLLDLSDTMLAWAAQDENGATQLRWMPLPNN